MLIVVDDHSPLIRFGRGLALLRHQKTRRYWQRMGGTLLEKYCVVPAEQRRSRRRAVFFSASTTIRFPSSKAATAAPALAATVAFPAQAGHGISDSLLRLSVGLENVEDLAADIAQALDGLHAAKGNAG